jgi:hypothetical protein
LTRISYYQNGAEVMSSETEQPWKKSNVHIEAGYESVL